MSEKHNLSEEEITKLKSRVISDADLFKGGADLSSDGSISPTEEQLNEIEEDEVLRQDGESLSGEDRKLYEKMMNTFRNKNIKIGDEIDVNCKGGYATSGYLVKITPQSFFLKIKTSSYGEGGFRTEEFKLADLDGVHRIMEGGVLDLSKDKKSIFPDETQF